MCVAGIRVRATKYDEIIENCCTCSATATLDSFSFRLFVVQCTNECELFRVRQFAMHLNCASNKSQTITLGNLNDIRFYLHFFCRLSFLFVLVVHWMPVSDVGYFYFEISKTIAKIPKINNDFDFSSAPLPLSIELASPHRSHLLSLLEHFHTKKNSTVIIWYKFVFFDGTEWKCNTARTMCLMTGTLVCRTTTPRFLLSENCRRRMY